MHSTRDSAPLRSALSLASDPQHYEISNMGLDAIVCCNCYETGNLKVAPDPSWGIIVEDDGHIEYSSNDIDMQIAFDKWRMYEACQHEDCILLHHYIGNIARIERLRASLIGSGKTLPIILNKIIYNATHCGDRLDIQTVQNLQSELNVLGDIHCIESQDEDRIRIFENQLRELVLAALEVTKPISF